jgi:hypothetical protein
MSDLSPQIESSQADVRQNAKSRRQLLANVPALRSALSLLGGYSDIVVAYIFKLPLDYARRIIAIHPVVSALLWGIYAVSTGSGINAPACLLSC